MALFGLGSRSQTPNRLGSVQVGTSEYGVAVPIAWGSCKVPIKLLDYTDFQSIGQSSSGGGKGGGGDVTSYEYYAAVVALLCAGPIGGGGNLYDSGGSAALLSATETYIIPAGGGTFTCANNGAVWFNDEGCTYPTTFSATANDFGSDGSITLSGTHPTPLERIDIGSMALGPGDYYVDSTGHYTFHAADAGKVVSISYTYTSADVTDDVSGPGSSGFDARSPAQRYGFSLALGTTLQPPWGYMLGTHPERALGYSGLAQMLFQQMSLGSDATTPNLSLEVLNGRLKAFGAGVADCDPAVIIADILTSADVGCNWPYLGDLTLFSNFCVANSMFMSLYLDSVRKASEVVQEICDLANAAPVWSGGLLKIRPYGCTTAVGYGRTFTPDTEPVYQIDESEMLCKPGEEPVRMGDPDLADNFNRVQYEYSSRNDNYNTALIHEQDEASILTNGLQPMKTVTAHHFCVQLYAAISMGMMLRRSSCPLRTFTFTLPWYFVLLEPMDIVQINLQLGALGLTAVRIVSIEEQEDYSLQVECEDFLFGTAQGVVYPKGAPLGNQPGSHDQPGNTSLLAAFQPTSRVTGGDEELWLALTGGPSWGGCNIHLSLDGASYSQVGTQYGSARGGTLTTPLAAGSDPDTTNTAAVAVAGSLATVTQAEADAFATLSLLGSELVSYETATLTSSTGSTNSYGLSYLRRGVFSTSIQDHSPGEIFIRLDNQVFKYVVDPSLRGKTVYLKFTSFNLYNGVEQLVDNVAPVIITLGGASASTMAVGSFVNSGGTTATVDVYLPGGATGASGSTTLPNGASLSLPPYSWTAEALGAWYGVNFNPAASAYVLYASQSAWLADQATMVPIGSTTTPASSSAASLPSSYSDTGNRATTTPAGAYTPGGTAVVGSSAAYIPMTPNPVRDSDPDPADAIDTVFNGQCVWSGWAGTTTTGKMLSLTAAAFVTGSGSVLNELAYSLDAGRTWTDFFSATAAVASSTFAAAVPSGTNLANVQVAASSSSSVTGTVKQFCGGTLTLSNLQIA
jgi:hypothetical protein